MTVARQGHMPLDGIKDTRGSVRAAATAHKQGLGSQNGLTIGGEWRISTDGDMNIVLSKRHKTRFVAEGYFFRLADALRYLVDAKVRQSDLSDLKAVVEKIEQLKRDIVGIAAG